MKFIVLIDNGADYAGELPGLFESEEAAATAGEVWLENFLDSNDIDPDSPDQPRFDLLPVTDSVQFKQVTHEQDCTCAETWPVLSEACAEGLASEVDELWNVTRFRK
jgi:hypothetical protein